MIRYVLQIATIILLAGMSSAFADTAIRVQDPAKFSEELFANYSPFKAGEIARKVAVTIGKPEAAETIENGLKLLDGKKIDTFRKVVDRDIHGALRQIKGLGEAGVVVLLDFLLGKEFLNRLHHMSAHIAFWTVAKLKG